MGNHKKVQDLMAGFGTDVTYSVNSVDHNGNTVLLVASKFGHKKIIRYCLRSGMQIDHINVSVFCVAGGGGEAHVV